MKPIDEFVATGKVTQTQAQKRAIYFTRLSNRITFKWYVIDGKDEVNAKRCAAVCRSTKSEFFHQAEIFLARLQHNAAAAISTAQTCPRTYREQESYRAYEAAKMAQRFEKILSDAAALMGEEWQVKDAQAQRK